MKLPTKYTKHTGRYSYDLPKQLLGERDSRLISIIDKDGVESKKGLCYIDWRNVIGWKIED